MRKSIFLLVPLLFLFLVPSGLAKNTETEQSPLSVEALILKGNELIKNRQYQEAIHDYEQVLDIDSKNVQVRLLLGLTYAQLGELEKALQHTKKASQLDPGYAAFYQLGLIYSAKRQPEQALKAFDRALKSSPKSYAAQYQKGLVYVSQKNYQKAAECYERARQFNPQFDDAYLALGGAYYQLGNKAAAFRQVEELRKVNKQKVADGFEAWLKEKESSGNPPPSP